MGLKAGKAIPFKVSNWRRCLECSKKDSLSVSVDERMRLASKNKPPLAGVSASGVEEAPPPGLVSEVDFPTELENSPGVGGNELAETAIILAGINVLELCMVPSVEGLQAKLEAAATGFTEREGLEEGHIPVVAARSAQGVVAEITPGSRCRRREGSWIKVLDVLIAGKHGAGIGDFANQVRPAACSAAKEVRYPAVGGKVNRQPGFDGYYARYLPATDRRLHKATRRVAEDRNVVNKVGDQSMGPIEAARTDVKSPSCIWVGNVCQISAATAGRRVNRPGIGVQHAQLQVFDLRVQVDLQGVVV